MSKEVLMVIEALSHERGIEKSLILEAIELALAVATKKRHTDEIDIRVTIDNDSGDYQTYRRWLVIADDAEMEHEEAEEGRSVCEIRLGKAHEIDPEIELEAYIEKEVESLPFGRIAAQAAKQIILQKIREAERAQIVEKYKDRVGELVMGVVKRMERGNAIIDLGSNTEAMIAREDMIPREAIRPGDRLRGYLKDVRSVPRGPQLFISRTAPELLVELFKLEVPEAAEGMIDIVGAARDPGLRAKIAVKSNDPRIDPVGACVGMRGSRVQSVSNEISGERVDIILWDENQAQFVINAMSPAEVESIVVDEEANSMDIAIREDQLSQAIGRGGQNVRLASQLTGWELNIMTEEQAVEKSEAEAEAIKQVFMEQLDVDESIATIFVQEGFSTIEEIAYVPAKELECIDEFDEEMVQELRDRARDVLLSLAIADKAADDGKQPAQDLLDLEGMDDTLARMLAKNDILTQEDLAEQAVDDLLEISDLDEERASALIMTARAPWFAEEQQG